MERQALGEIIQQLKCGVVMKIGYSFIMNQLLKDAIFEENFLGLESDKPWWLGDEKLHYSHKGRLHEKDPEKYYFYSEYSDYRELGYTCCNKCQYFWPTHVDSL